MTQPTAGHQIVAPYRGRSIDYSDILDDIDARLGLRYLTTTRADVGPGAGLTGVGSWQILLQKSPRRRCGIQI